MNTYTAKPRRALSTNFTEHTLMRSIKAKQYGPQRKNYIMYRFVKRPAGALIALAVLSLGAVGTYAAANWFNGHVGVKTDDTVLSIDLSSCKNAFLPGFPDNQDMHKVQFKILGEPHISEVDLQQALLNLCESNAVTDFYRTNPSTKDVDLHSATITAIRQNSLTLSYIWGGQAISKEFSVDANATFYNQGTPTDMDGLRIGQFVMVATPRHASYTEGVDPLQDITSIVSVFVTQYNTATAPGNGKKNFSYPDSNIMPLGMYEQLHKK